MVFAKIKQLVSIKRIAAVFGLGLLIAVGIWHPLYAQDVTQGYSSSEVMQRGMMVSLKSDDTTKVEPTTLDNQKRLHGVVVNANDAPVTLSSVGEQVFVATTGRYDALVSDQNGTVSPGDYVSISLIRGIGTKTGDKDEVVLGKALTGFDGKTGVVSTTELKDEGNNTSKQVNIGRISVDIAIASNPFLKPRDSNLPDFLKRASEEIAGRAVSPMRVYISLAILIVTTIVTAVLLYTGIRSGIISLGRNPLSKKMIVRSMMQVIVTSLIIFITGVFGVYLLLKL